MQFLYNDTVASPAVSSKEPETKTVTETTTLKETPQNLEGIV